MSICKTVLRWTLISGVAIGGITILVGPDRVAAAFETVQDKAGTVVDNFIDQEEARALRQRLHDLAAEYPDRIAEVRGEVAKIETQLEQLHHDTDVARRVVAMTEADLTAMAAQVENARSQGTQIVSLVEGDAGVDLEVAYREGRRIRDIHQTYQQRLLADQRQVELLQQQHERMTSLLDQIEREHAQYQAQVWQLDRQIDAIERNDRLIALTESQQETLHRFRSPQDVESIRQIESRLAELSAVQEGTLQALAEQGQQHEYEARAQAAMGSPMTGVDPFDGFKPAATSDMFAQHESLH